MLITKQVPLHIKAGSPAELSKPAFRRGILKVKTFYNSDIYVFLNPATGPSLWALSEKRAAKRSKQVSSRLLLSSF